MAVEVARGVLSRIRRNPGAIVVRVRDASDPEAAAEALRRARPDIMRLDAGPGSAPGLGPGDANNPKYVGEVLPAAGGPCLFVDGGHTPYRLLRTIPEVVAGHLRSAGVEDAVVDAADQGGPILDAASSAGEDCREVLLCLFPPPPPSRQHASAMPEGWIEVARDWVCGHGDGQAPLLAQVAPAIEFPLPPAQASQFLRQCRAARNAASVLVSGDLGRHVHGANGRFRSGVPTMTLAASGPGLPEATVLGEMGRLVALAEALADQVAYAFVAIKPSLGIFTTIGISGDDAASRPGAEQAERMQFYCDRIVLDAFPYQVLGPGHLERLGGPPPETRLRPAPSLLQLALARGPGRGLSLDADAAGGHRQSRR